VAYTYSKSSLHLSLSSTFLD